MPGTLTVHLDRPIGLTKIPDHYSGGSRAELSGGDGVDSQPGVEQTLMQAPWAPGGDAEAQRAALSQVNQALREATAKLNEFYDTMFAAHREEIARLAVEIARKILAQKVENGDYKIEPIIKEALSNAPVRQDVVVRLNPADLTEWQKLRENEPGEDFTGINFVPDASIGRAECVLETPKGIIESLIDQHLEQIGKALRKVK
jgi:flagellar biosynthesis/type III secretory pathway protein FliH